MLINPSLSPHHLQLHSPSPRFPPSLLPRFLRRPYRRTFHRNFRPNAVLESLQPVLSATSVLTAIIVVHESGHFLAATLQGIRVSKFAIGFGPILTRFTRSGVEYSLRAFPLGGYVAFPDSDDPDCGVPADDPDLLRNRPVLDRIVVVSAGVVANLVFAYALVFTQALTSGLPVQEPLPGVLVPDVRPGSAAARAGLLPGDVVLSSPSVSDLVALIKLHPSEPIPLQIRRGALPGPAVTLTVVPDEGADGTGRIGVQLAPNFKVGRMKAEGVRQAGEFAGREFGALARTVFEGLRQTFLNFAQSAERVSGPVAIIAVGASVAKSSSDGLFTFAAIINLNLAAINLLPLPALDGGTLFLLLVEAARGGRRIPREVERGINSSGVLVVLVLGVFLIVRDTLNLDFIKERL